MYLLITKPVFNKIIIIYKSGIHLYIFIFGKIRHIKKKVL